MNNSRTINILFLGGGKRVAMAQCFKQYGESCGIRINIFSYELVKEVPIAAEGEVIIGLKWKEEGVTEHLKEVIALKEIDIILPFVDPAVELAGRLKPECGSVFIPVSDSELCQVMFDKLSAAHWFAAHGIPQPIFYNGVIGYDYPVILKPRWGSASKGIRVIFRAEEFPCELNKEDYIIQEYIADRIEYTVDCYVGKNGEIISIVPRIREEVAGGEVTRSKVVREEAVIEITEKILKAGDFRGPVTIQFIKDKRRDELYIMEINPRLGGGVIASIAAGSGMISFIIKEMLGEEIKRIDNWKAGTLMTRYLKEVIFYADRY